VIKMAENCSIHGEPNIFCEECLKEEKPKLIMNDVSNAKYVEISIRQDGKTLWVNTEKGCVLRISNIDNLRFDDRRIKDSVKKNGYKTKRQ
jgi:hypothetical protein